MFPAEMICCKSYSAAINVGVVCIVMKHCPDKGYGVKINNQAQTFDAFLTTCFDMSDMT